MTLEFNSSEAPENAKPTVYPVADNEHAPIESKMRQTLLTLKDTRYQDSFDWSVYDRIAKRFEEPPRGGVVFNTTFKLVNHHSSCSKCFYAFEIDTYGRGCLHDCKYCYAKETLTTHGYWNRPMPFPVNLAEVRKVFYTIFETSKPSRWREIMEKRIPLRIGSMSDSFMWLDLKYGVTKELLKILAHYRYPYVVFTRSDLAAHDDYLELFDKDLCAVQYSIAGNNATLNKQLEPGAPSFERRLKALEKLTKAGIWTTARINPLFPKYPDGFFTDRDDIKNRFGSFKNAPSFDLYDDDFVRSIADAGVPTLLAGFVRLSPRSIKLMGEASGVDLKQFFKPEIMAQNGDKKYSDSEISYYYKWFNRMCQENGMRFTTCYIGNGMKDYFNYQDLWSNKSDCCDVIGNVKSFKTTSQDVSWDRRIAHAPNKEDAIKAMDEEKLAEFTSGRSTQLQPGSMLEN
jgi:DNA repair photolyase